MSDITLSSIFDSHADELAERLRRYSLPKDAREVEATVSEFLSAMFENDGVYRQSLTQSEDYILQSAIQLLQAQQHIATEIVTVSSHYCSDQLSVSEMRTEQHTNPYTTLIGTGMGAITGAILSPWVAVGGAIAGTAVAIYLSTKPKSRRRNTGIEQGPTINVEAFVSIIRKICENVDDLIATYRVQVKRIRHTYESREEVTLQNTYVNLLDRISDVIRLSKNEANTPIQLKQAINMLAESLGNYDLKYENGRIINE